MNPKRICSLVTLLTVWISSLSDGHSAPSRLDPAAMDALKHMSNTLANSPAFTYRSKTMMEVPSRNGQFITLFSTGSVALKRPDRLLAKLRGSAPHFDFYFADGQVSAYAPGAHVYSTKFAPETIDAMLAGLQAETGIRFASAPLLNSNPYAVMTRGLTSAIFVGPTQVDGVRCDHLAFRAPGVNWEIWVESNQRALPRRLATTFTDRPNFPRTIVEFSHWNLRPLCLWDSKFIFQAPAGAKEIPFASTLRTIGR